MVILAIVQARTSSTRLPGKVLRPILGRPMILQQLDRIGRARSIDRIVVATSVEASDDELAGVLAAAGSTVRRGPLDDVLSRFITVMDEFAPTAVVRLTGDNPLVDPDVIDVVVAEHLRSGADYTANGLPPRTYPYGLDVEVFRADALRRLAGTPTTPEEREHVTLGLYRRVGEYLTHGVTQRPDRSRLRWTVDVPEDLEWVSGIFERFADEPGFGQEDVVRLLQQEPALVRTLDQVRP